MLEWTKGQLSQLIEMKRYQLQENHQF